MAEEIYVRSARKDYECIYCGDIIHAKTSHIHIVTRPWDLEDGDGYLNGRAHRECNRYGMEYYGNEDGVYDPETSFDAEGFKDFMRSRVRYEDND